MSEHKEGGVLARFASPLIILATIIWGSSFVVMKNSVDVLPTYWLLAIRFSFAALVLAIVFIRRWKVLDRQYLIGGTVMGFCLFVAYASRPSAWRRPPRARTPSSPPCTASSSPSCTGSSPRRRPDKFNVLAALLCIAGIALVSVTGENATAFNIGDVLTLIAASSLRPHRGGGQIFPRGGTSSSSPRCSLPPLPSFSWIGVLVTRPALDVAVFNQDLVLGLAYLVIFSSCGALLFQNIGQKYTAPATRAVLLSLEAPFGVLFSILLANERPTPLMFVGFALIFLAVVCSETKFSFLRKKEVDKV